MKALYAVKRTTLNLRPQARRIAEERAQYKAISIGDAVSDLIEEAEALRPKARLEMRDGLPVLVAPPGTPKLTMEMVKEMLEDEW
ncbi:MAG: antitoxin [Panacagrimonas sp.]